MGTTPSSDECATSGPVPGVQRRERLTSVWLYISAPLACVAAVVVATYIHPAFVLSPPLVVGILWLVLRRKSTFVDTHGREVISIVLATMLLFGASVFLGSAAVLVWPLIVAFVVICFVCGGWHAVTGWNYRAPICCHLRG